MSAYQRNNPATLRWIILAPVFALVAFAVTFIGLSIYFHAVSPQAYYYGSLYYWRPFFFFGFGWILIIPIIILIFFGLRWFFWGAWGWGYYRRYYDPALETLRERFARGEITKEQFDQMSRDLQQQHH